MNFLTKILKELAQEFIIPEVIERKLFQRIFIAKKTKEKMITEKYDNG